ncbi:hypothetical protein HOC01_03810 [archaeon]|jgi:HTH-type transcriptional regulator, sugar sensing transcriptional regulator|nr:hypothetical protein [archaeon]MBT6698462.1 hypothetical protein [archaeon]
MDLKEAGLTNGESKVYLALLQVGSSTTGPIIEKSGVSHSIIYKILENLIQKGLVSYVTKNKTKYFQAAEPKRLLDYIEERKEKLDQSKEKISRILPSLMLLMNETEDNSVKLFEGFKGFQTAWELYYSKLKKGEEYHSWGVYPIQDKRFDLYWMRDHVRRGKTGIKGKILFNEGTNRKTLKNRNSYKGMDCRIMPSKIKTPAWFIVYKNVTGIFLQGKNPVVVQIINQEIADSFEAYFQDLWTRSKKFK